MSTFKEIFHAHDGRLIHKWPHYFDVYEKYFSRYKGTPLNILEIGISHGGSLQMWRKYFGDKANIFAVDIIPECKKFEEEKTKIFIGSQEDEAFLVSLISRLPPLDIVIDDGGHTMKQQITTFNHLFEHVKEGGIYMVEDTHTSYWRAFQGGFKKKSSFIEFSKNIVDQIHAWHIDNNRKAPVNYITRNVDCISFYDSIVVFEKKIRSEPYHSMKGEKTLEAPEENQAKKSSLKRKLRKKIRIKIRSREKSYPRHAKL